MNASATPTVPHYKPHLRCPDCRLHRSLCVCALMQTIATRTRIVLVTHPYEVNKPTNTGRIVERCLPTCEVVTRAWYSEGGDLPTWLSPAANPVLLFPGANARPPADFQASPDPVTLVVPDGTWHQAMRIHKRIISLGQFPRIALPPGPPSMYRLRKSVRPEHLCTLEAIARILGVLEGAVGPDIEARLLHLLRIVVDRTLWSKGRLPRDEVTGGIPDGVRQDDPLGLLAARAETL